MIIFDLDDTLIDTSVSITPKKLDSAFARMVAEGMSLPNEEEGLEVLRRLNATAPSAREALEEFIEIYEVPRAVLQVGLHEVYENYSDDIPVFPLKGALEVIKEFSRDHDLAIVTAGIEDQQKEKMKKAGIDFSAFRKIIVCSSKEKKLYYQKIWEQSGVAEDDVVVCGDRINTDLTPAKELGFTTVQMLFGRGVYAPGNKNDVDYTISDLMQLKNIVANLSGISFSKIGKSW